MLSIKENILSKNREMLLLIWLMLLGGAWGKHYCYTADWNGYTLHGKFIISDTVDTNSSTNYGNFTVSSGLTISVPNEFHSEGSTYTIQITNDDVSEYVGEVVDEIYISARNTQMSPVIWMNKFAILPYHEIAIHFFTFDLNTFGSNKIPDFLTISMFPDYHVIYVEGLYRYCPTCNWDEVTYYGDILTLTDCTPTVTPTPTSSVVPSSLETPSVTPAPTVSETPSQTMVMSGTPTQTMVMSETPSQTMVMSGTPTQTVVMSGTPTLSPSQTVVKTPTVLGTPSQTVVETPTVSGTPSQTVSGTPTVSGTLSQTVPGIPSSFAIQNTTVFNITDINSNSTSILLTKHLDQISAEINITVANTKQTDQPSSESPFIQQKAYIYVIIGGLICIVAFVMFVVLRKRRARAKANTNRVNQQKVDIFSYSKQSEKVNYQVNPTFLRTASLSGVSAKDSVEQVANKQTVRTELHPLAIPSDFKEFSMPNHRHLNKLRPECNDIGKVSRHKFNPIKKDILPVRPAYDPKEADDMSSDIFMIEAPKKVSQQIRLTPVYHEFKLGLR